MQGLRVVRRILPGEDHSHEHDYKSAWHKYSGCEKYVQMQGLRVLRDSVP